MSELERALAGLDVEWPQTPDLAAAVRAEIALGTAGDARASAGRDGVAAPGEVAAGRGVVAPDGVAAPGGVAAGRGVVAPDGVAAPGRATRWRRSRVGRRVAIAAAAVLVAAGGTLAVSPSARSTVSRWLGLQGVVIEKGPPSATPAPSHDLGESLALGVPITPRQASRAGGLFPAGLPAPDAAYLGPLVGGQHPVALVYAPRPGLPASKVTGVALIVQTFRASLDPILFKKMAADVHATTVDGAPAYWISGGAHGFMYATADGNGAFVPQRLADHTLLVERRDHRLLRIEGPLTLKAAKALAESVH